MVISIGQIIGNFKNFRRLSNFRGNLGIFDSETEKKQSVTMEKHGQLIAHNEIKQRATHPPSHTHTRSTPPNPAGTMLSNTMLHRTVLEQASYSGKGHFLLIVIYPGPTSQFEQRLTHLQLLSDADSTEQSPRTPCHFIWPKDSNFKKGNHNGVSWCMSRTQPSPSNT